MSYLQRFAWYWNRATETGTNFLATFTRICYVVPG